MTRKLNAVAFGLMGFRVLGERETRCGARRDARGTIRCQTPRTPIGRLSDSRHTAPIGALSRHAATGVNCRSASSTAAERSSNRHVAEQ